MNVRALKDRAVRLTSAGKLRKALEAWEQLAELEPGEPQNLVRCAEIRRRVGDYATSVQLYLRAAEAFAQAGFLSRAQAALTLAAKIAPTAEDVVAVRARLERRPHVEPRPRTYQPQPRDGRIRALSIEMEVVEIPIPAPAPAPHRAARSIDDAAAAVQQNSASVRRINASSVAVPAPAGGWVVLSSEAAIRVEYVEELPADDEAICGVELLSAGDEDASLPS